MTKTPKHDPNTLPSKAAILDFIAGNPGKIGTREIARAFGLKNDLRADLKRLLRDLADEGVVARGGHKGKKLHHPGALASTLLADIVSRDRDGELIAVPDEWDEEEHDAAPRIRIHAPRKPRPGEATGLGDKVLLHVDEVEPEDGIRYRGRVIKIIERVKHRVLGIFRADARGGGRLEPVDKKMLGREMHIPQGATGDARDGDLVAVEAQRTSRFGPPNGRIVERLGSLKSEKAVSLIAIHTHSIPDVFRRDTLNEAEAARPATLAGREDWRKLPLITIDPADAKDHDDAVHAAADDDPSNPGGFVVTVAIADVAHYVTPGSALDREALVRGNSVYFPDRVVPMLPERISNDLCSLKPNEDRASLAVRMVIGADGRKRSHAFHRILMRSAAKLAYEQAQAAIDGRPDETTGPLLEPVLKPLYAAYDALKRERAERGPLDLDSPERKILLKPDGMVDRVVVPGRLDAHRLIEEMMILANVAAAETLEKARTPLIYRVHDEPSLEKIEALREFLKSLDINIAKAGALRASNFNFILGRVKDSDRETLVNEVVLRSQAQAEYSAENYGHFGLNLRRYAHFTSPIRRYADLIVHRALIRALHLGPDGLPGSFGLPELAEIAAEISATERRAMLAERETKDRLIAHFLADRVGATFEGKVGGVHRAGLFVKLSETGADGFVPARTIGDEYFRYDEAGHALTGTRTGESFRLGDSVTVKLVEAAPVAGALRFELLSHGRRGTPPSGRERFARGGIGKKSKFKDYGRKADQTFKSDTAKGHDEKKRSEERRRKFGKKNSRHKVRKNKGKRK
ncbi:MAG: ribonuclease R [Proteobacteria bacterium]|nr:ribonuclease R [Pseudomonadota bacterium]